MALNTEKFDIDEALDSLDLTYNGYIPSQESLEFFVLMRLVAGKDFEYTTPLTHYFLVDLLLGNIKTSEHFPYSEDVRKKIKVNAKRLSVMMSRGLAKSSVVTCFFPVYVAIKGTLKNFGKQYFYLGLAASAQGGGRVMSKAIQSMCEDSEFCKSYFESMRFTETEAEFTRKGTGDKDSRTFLFRTMGIGTGSIRGVRSNVGAHRPDCHVKGTIVTTEYGTYPVEQHPSYKSDGHFEIGKQVRVRGLPTTEVTSTGHKYWAKLCTGNKCHTTSDGKTKRYTEESPRWTSVEELTTSHWIGSRIPTDVVEPQPIMFKEVENIKQRSADGRILGGATYKEVMKVHPYMHTNDWWWMYGLWLGNGTLSTNGTIVWTIANTQEQTVGAKLCSILSSLGKAHSIQRNGLGCYTVHMTDVALHRWLTNHKAGNSVKNMPMWVTRIAPEKQLEILKGYIAADGYIDTVNNQVRIPSVNYDVLVQLQVMASRLNLPTYIRNTKKAGEQVWFNGAVSKHKQQWELRLKEGCNKILGITSIDEPTKIHHKQVHISDGLLWRQVLSIEDTAHLVELVPIQCNNNVLAKYTQTPHAYETSFGISKNCLFFDDCIANTAAAYSDTQMDTFRETLNADAINALVGGGKGRIVLIFTPFHLQDPNVQTITSGAYTPLVVPICKEIHEDMSRAEFQGAWESMHPYDAVRDQYEQAKLSGALAAFNQERMLRLMSADDRLIGEECIQWYDRNLIMKLIGGYSLYITTDFTTTSESKSDFSGLAVWAVSANADYFLLDLCLRRQGLQEQYDELFRMVRTWGRGGRYIEVGVETDGQQRAHLFTIKQMMQKYNVYFSFARQKGAGNKEGISSRAGNTSKIDRFRYCVPKFQNGKVYFPEQLRENKEMKEMLKQIRGATHTGFTTHDDGPDLISQLEMIDVRLPVDTEYVAELPKANVTYWGRAWDDEDDEKSSNSMVF